MERSERFAEYIKRSYNDDNEYREWFDNKTDILEMYTYFDKDLDFNSELSRIYDVNKRDIFYELLSGKDNLTNDKESSKVEEDKKSSNEAGRNILDTISTILMAASAIPVADTVTNLASIPIDLLRRDYVSAGLDLLGIIPGFGEVADVAKTARFADKAVDAIKVADKAADAAKAADKTVDAARAVDKATDAGKAVDRIETAQKIKADIVIEGHSGTPKTAKANSVIDHKDQSGRVDIRSFYDGDTYKKKDIHTTNHGNPKRHPYGKNGEHVEEYVWDKEGKLKFKKTRELTEVEREENSDILWTLLN